MACSRGSSSIRHGGASMTNSGRPWGTTSSGRTSLFRAEAAGSDEGRDFSRVDVLGISPVLKSSSGLTGITQSRSASEDYMPGWAVSLTDPQRLYVASRFGPFVWEDEEEDPEKSGNTGDKRIG